MTTTDFTKLFDPAQYTQNMQKLFDMNAALSAGKQNVEIAKKVGTMVADTLSSCTEKQMKYAQSTVEDCIEAMRELSTAKGVDEYMQKQAHLGQKAAERAQSMAQEIASQWQKSQTQCSDLIGKQVAQGVEWGKSITQPK